MIANRNSFEHCEPITWVGRVPVYLSTVLAAAQAAGMIITALAMMAGGQKWFFSTFGFFPPTAVQGLQVWQFFTYAFVSVPGLMSAIQIVLLAIFGREVEKFVGRVSFAWLYGLLVLATPLFLAALSFLGIDRFYAGSEMVQFAVFISFVLLYPSAEIFFSIQARWFGIAFLAIYTLQAMAYQDWVGLGVLWLECLVAALWLAREGFNPLSLPTLPSVKSLWSQRKSRRNLRVVPREPEPKNEEASVHDSIDPILEKIASRGIGSLTRAEKEKLERARTALLEKERSN